MTKSEDIEEGIVEEEEAKPEATSFWDIYRGCLTITEDFRRTGWLVFPVIHRGRVSGSE